MYIDMSERIAGKQDRPSLIIDPQGPPNSQKITFWPIYEKLVINCCDEVCIC